MENHQKNLLEELKTIKNWHHKIDLGDGISTPAVSPTNPEAKWNLIEPFIPSDLTGKTVLDLGCNSGYFSVQMKKRGASRVVSVDNYDDAIKQTNFLAKWFDVELEVIKQEAHIYCLTTNEQFDYVLFLGLFYHLKYGVLVLDRLANMTKSRLFFQSATIGPKINEYVPDEDFTKNDNELYYKMEDFPKLYFIEQKYRGGAVNWWLPNDSAILSLLRSSGLKIIARPSKEVIVCDSDHCFGDVVIDKMIFPKFGKRDHPNLVGHFK